MPNGQAGVLAVDLGEVEPAGAVPEAVKGAADSVVVQAAVNDQAEPLGGAADLDLVREEQAAVELVDSAEQVQEPAAQAGQAALAAAAIIHLQAAAGAMAQATLGGSLAVLAVVRTKAKVRGTPLREPRSKTGINRTHQVLMAQRLEQHIPIAISRRHLEQMAPQQVLPIPTVTSPTRRGLKGLPPVPRLQIATSRMRRGLKERPQALLTRIAINPT